MILIISSSFFIHIIIHYYVLFILDHPANLCLGITTDRFYPITHVQRRSFSSYLVHNNRTEYHTVR